MEKMQDEKIIMSSKKVNVLALLFSLGMLVICLPLFYVLYGKESLNTQMYPFLFKIIVLILGIFIHEGIHGLFFSIYNADGFKGIKFGFSLKKMVAYCHCKNAIKIYQTQIVLIMPFIILGVLPLVIGFIFNNFFWVIFGIVYCAASIGDLLIFFKLIRKNRNLFFKDSTTYCGGEIIHDNNINHE